MSLKVAETKRNPGMTRTDSGALKGNCKYAEHQVTRGVSWGLTHSRPGDLAKSLNLSVSPVLSGTQSHRVCCEDERRQWM